MTNDQISSRHQQLSLLEYPITDSSPSRTAEDATDAILRLQPSTLPARFRLDMRTRQRGLARIAEIRRQAAARQAARLAA